MTPQTPTGKRLLAEFDGRPGPLEPRRILAIEAEAIAIGARGERERLRTRADELIWSWADGLGFRDELKAFKKALLAEPEETP